MVNKSKLKVFLLSRIIHKHDIITPQGDINVNDNDWLLLKSLYEERNITRTAQKFYISQPSLSARIQKMEAELGVTIITRLPRGIKFTTEGELVVRYALDELTQFKKLKDDLQSISHSHHGFLKFGCSNVFAKYHLPTLLSKFQRLYPFIEINLKTGYSQNLYRDFLQNELQLVIIRNNHQWGEKKQLLWKERLCIFSSTPLDLEDLPSMSFIHYNTDPPLQEVLDTWWYANYQSPPKTAMEVDDMGTCMKILEYSPNTYTILSESCEKELEKPLYKYPLPLKNNDIVYRQTWLYSRNIHQSSPPIKAFIDFVENEYS